MLKISKSISMTGQSEIGEKVVATMNATISAESQGNSYVNQNILDDELYKANRSAVRKDFSEFQEAIYDVEDQLSEEKKEKK